MRQTSVYGRLSSRVVERGGTAGSTSAAADSPTQSEIDEVEVHEHATFQLGLPQPPPQPPSTCRRLEECQVGGRISCCSSRASSRRGPGKICVSWRTALERASVDFRREPQFPRGLEILFIDSIQAPSALLDRVYSSSSWRVRLAELLR